MKIERLPKTYKNLLYEDKVVSVNLEVYDATSLDNFIIIKYDGKNKVVLKEELKEIK